jgi:phage major head subunit gpT-like protein
MTMVSDNWAELLEPGLRVIWNKHLKDKKDYIGLIYNEDNSTKAAEHNLGTGSVGVMDEWSATGNQVSYEDVNKGFKSNYVHKKYSKGIQIERELADDDQYGEIKKRVNGLAQSVYYTRQVHAASVFNNAFNGSFAGPDGKALCAADHPLAPGSVSTFSNFGALALSEANLETVRNNMKAWTDDKGNLLAIDPDTIIVPPALRKAALVIVDSAQQPDTNYNNINVYKGTMKVIEWDFLTDTNAWFVADSSRMKQFLHWFNRRKPILEQEKSFDTEVAKYKTVGRWSFGFDDPTFIYGNNPS